tara:strand:+ start:16830 stop:17834 length:1005 start_codon:yes stop_codon:yes gene_type:complete
MAYNLPQSEKTLPMLRSIGESRDSSIDNMIAGYFQGAGGRVLGNLAQAEAGTLNRINEVMDRETRLRVANESRDWIEKENEKRTRNQAMGNMLLSAGSSVAGGVLSQIQTETDKALKVPPRKTDKQIEKEDLAELGELNAKANYQAALEKQAAGLTNAPAAPSNIAVIPATEPGTAPLRIDLSERAAAPSVENLIAEYAARQKAARGPRMRVDGGAELLSQARARETLEREPLRGQPTKDTLDRAEALLLAERIHEGAVPNLPPGPATAEQLWGAAALAPKESGQVIRNPAGGDPYEYTKLNNVWYTRDPRSGGGWSTLPAKAVPLVESWVGGR